MVCLYPVGENPPDGVIRDERNEMEVCLEGQGRVCSGVTGCRRKAMIVGVTLSVILGIRPGAAQEPPSVFLIADTVACEDCRIDLTRVVSLGGSEESDTLSLDASSRVAVDSNGRFALSSPFEPGRVLIYDKDGTLVGGFGSRGEGPGEMQAIQWMTYSPGDTLHVFDRSRWVVFSPGEEHVRTTNVPFRVFRPIRLDSGDWVLTSPYLAAGRNAGSLQIFSEDGYPARTISEEPKELLGPFDDSAVRHLSPASPGMLWVGQATQYVVEKRTATGEVVQKLWKDCSWFPRHEYLPLTRMEPPIRPTMGAIREDAYGRLWVLIWVPEEEEQGSRTSDVPGQDLRDTILEVIDPTTGRLLAHRRFDEWLLEFVNEEMLVGRRVETGGEWAVDIYRFTLRSGV